MRGGGGSTGIHNYLINPDGLNYLLCEEQCSLPGEGREAEVGIVN